MSTTAIPKKITLKIDEQTVKELLSELDLEDKYFIVLVNGKKAELSDRVTKEDEIIVLPRLVGG